MADLKSLSSKSMSVLPQGQFLLITLFPLKGHTFCFFAYIVISTENSPFEIA